MRKLKYKIIQQALINREPFYKTHSYNMVILWKKPY